MLDIFAQSNAAGMRADRYAKFSCHQQDDDHLVQTAESRAINLTKVDRPCLEKLFKHHTVMTMLAGCYPDRRDLFSNRSMLQNVVRAGRFFDPPRFKFRQTTHVAYGLLDIPNLVGVHHELALPTNLLPQNSSATNVLFDIAADLLF